MGHHEAAAAAASGSTDTPPGANSAASLPGSTAVASKGRTHAASMASAEADDLAEELVAEVPPPMDPIAPLPPVTSNPSVTTATSSSIGGAASPGDDPHHPSSSSEMQNDDERQQKEQTNNVITAETVERAIQQRSYRLQELLYSERIYVEDLEHCCEYIKYMRESKEMEVPEVPMPEDLREGKDRMIFGNIEAIYEWHREYVVQFLHCFLPD